MKTTPSDADRLDSRKHPAENVHLLLVGDEPPLGNESPDVLARCRVRDDADGRSLATRHRSSAQSLRRRARFCVAGRWPLHPATRRPRGRLQAEVSALGHPRNGGRHLGGRLDIGHELFADRVPHVRSAASNTSNGPAHSEPATKAARDHSVDVLRSRDAVFHEREALAAAERPGADWR